MKILTDNEIISFNIYNCIFVNFSNLLQRNGETVRSEICLVSRFIRQESYNFLKFFSNIELFSMA